MNWKGRLRRNPCNFLDLCARRWHTFYFDDKYFGAHSFINFIDSYTLKIAEIRSCRLNNLNSDFLRKLARKCL